MIVIDGVIWQSGGYFHSPEIDQSQMWLSLISEWVADKKATQFVVLTRGQTWMPPGTFFSEIPPFSFEEAEDDRVGLQSACDQLDADLFISTGYTTPLTTPSISCIYDLEAEIHGSQFQSEYIEKKNSILNASHYICLSDNVLSGFRSYYPGICPEQISLVYPAIGGWAKPAAPDALAEFRRKFKLTRPFFLAVLPEYLTDYRGIQSLSQAWELLQAQKLSRTELVFVFPSHLQVDPAKAQLPQANGIHYLSLSNPELACAYSAALALISHSTFRVDSPLEAMACGCPVINYRDERSGASGLEPLKLTQIEEQPSAFLLCQGSIQQLAEALERIQLYQVRSPLIAKGLEKAKELSWSAMAKKFWDIFEQVAPQIKQNPKTENPKEDTNLTKTTDH
ncbi:MAG: hypothetical protein ACUVRV_04450 [Cyanobacteriota bacterium]